MIFQDMSALSKCFIIILFSSLIVKSVSQIIFAGETLSNDFESCSMGTKSYLMDSYDNLMLFTDECGQLLILEAPVLKNQSLTVVTKRSTGLYGGQMTFDKRGFLISIVRISKQKYLIRNESIDGVISWEYHNMSSSEHVVFAVDETNQLSVIQNTAMKIDNSGKLIAEFEIEIDQTLYVGFGFFSPLAITPDGNWVISVAYWISRNQQLYFVDMQQKKTSWIGEYLMLSNPKINMLNATAFYITEWSSGQQQLVLFAYDKTNGNWTKTAVRSLYASCSHFQILRIDKTSKFHILAACMPASRSSIYIFGFPPKTDNPDDIYLGTQMELFSLKNYFNSINSVSFLESTDQLVFEASFGRNAVIGDFSFESNVFYWLIVNLVLKTDVPAVNTMSKSSTSYSKPTQAPPPFPTEPSLDANRLAILYSTIGVFSFLFFLFLLYYVYLRYKNSRGNYQVKKEPERDAASTVVRVDNTQGLRPQETISRSANTLISGQRELSMPGYMEMNFENDVILQNQIARGGTASIYLAKIQNAEVLERSKSSKCIAKVLKYEANTEQQASFHQEVAIMAFFRTNKNFASIIGYSESPAVLFMKFYSLGSLSKWIHKSSANQNSSRVVLRFASNIITGIMNLHDENFVHCDIKPENILIENDPQYGLHAVITDFGIARILESSSMIVNGFQVANKDGWSIAYCPPESFLSELQKHESASSGQVTCTQQSLKSTDVYMFGMCLYEMITKKVPYEDLKSSVKTIEAILRGEKPPINWQLIQNDATLNGIASIMMECWDIQPELRPLPQIIIQNLKKLKPQKD